MGAAAGGSGIGASECRDEGRTTLGVQEARLANWDIKNLNRMLQDKAAEMALAKQPMPRQQADTGVCFPMDTPRLEALNRLSTAAGESVDEP
jgi:hypothetical protein